MLQQKLSCIGRAILIDTSTVIPKESTFLQAHHQVTPWLHMHLGQCSSAETAAVLLLGTTAAVHNPDLHTFT
jgi:hypothetical protein